MKLDYKIIWVEDKIDTEPFQDLVNDIKEHLENEFFNVKIDTAEDYDDFVKIYESQDTFDLIITDLNLNESHGSQVIDFIRDEKHNFTEIFFYSANKELNNARLINSSRITFHQLEDQRYHKELGNSIKDLINLTISKFQHIISMRGMIMQETSSLDSIMDNIVKNQLKNPDFKKDAEEILTTVFKNILDNAKEKYDKAVAKKAKVILKDNVLFNSSQKVFALGQILNKIGKEDFSADYSKEVVLIRNQFAHAELFKNENGDDCFKVKGEEVIFDNNLCRTIRNNIIKHSKNIDSLKTDLGM